MFRADDDDRDRDETMSNTRKPSAARDDLQHDGDEYGALVALVRSAGDDVAAVNAGLSELPRLRDRMARLDEYALRPLRIADPVRHLDNALGFVLTAMGRPDLANGLLRATRTAAYRLVVGYMRAYLVRANEHCYAAAAAQLPADAPVVLLRESTYRRHVQTGDGPCARLDGGRWIDLVDRRRVRGTVRHIFACWESRDGDVGTTAGGGGGLRMFFTYDQYERLSRHGVFRLAPGGRLLAGASVPADPALLRMFVRVQYTDGYLSRLMRSLRSTFAPPFLEALAATYVLRASGGADGGGGTSGGGGGGTSGGGTSSGGGSGFALEPATVTEAARDLKLSWFAEDTETPEAADLFYAHTGFHPE